MSRKLVNGLHIFIWLCGQQ